MNNPAGRHPSDDRLESWKEIAAYLKKDIRTVQTLREIRFASSAFLPFLALFLLFPDCFECLHPDVAIVLQHLAGDVARDGQDRLIAGDNLLGL